MDNAQYYAMQNIPTYSTTGNLRERGYPSSYDYNPVEYKPKNETPTNNGGGGKTGTGTSTSQATSGGGYDMASYLAELNAQRRTTS